MTSLLSLASAPREVTPSMRSPFARLAVLSALALSLVACSTSNGGSSLPFAGTPNNAGGTPGTIQSGSNGTALIRFIQGSPDYGSVDVCIDSTPLGVPFSARPYGTASALFAIAGGISHTMTVYPASAANGGGECATAPGPYFGTAPLVVTTLGVGNSVRWTVVLGGTALSKTFGLYVFAEPTFAAAAPAGAAAVSHNAAPAFSTGKANGVGFGICTTTATPCATAVALSGAQGVAPAKVSAVGAAVTNNPVTSGLNSIPAGFYDGIGVPAGTPVPITSVAAPAEVAGQPYYIQLYAIDAPAGGLNLVPVLEQTLGYGF